MMRFRSPVDGNGADKRVQQTRVVVENGEQVEKG
jgi:hypothetical protein